MIEVHVPLPFQYDSGPVTVILMLSVFLFFFWNCAQTRLMTCNKHVMYCNVHSSPTIAQYNSSHLNKQKQNKVNTLVNVLL